MRKIILLFFSLFGYGVVFSQMPSNPILFVTAVPTPYDSSTQCSPFGNHLANMYGAPRGGDLWIRYPDGTTKNITQIAGYGVATGLQGLSAIAVREPSVHWSGTKALFSMIVGGANNANDTSTFFWQIYEVTGLGKNETPVITRINSQPNRYNNVSPIYSVEDKIIFTSDRPRNGEKHLYPTFDEYKGQLTNTGLWMLNPTNGDLTLLDHSPSGDFTPIIDSYGKIVFMRWDRLQRDREADTDFLGTSNYGTFNYTNESATGQPQYSVRNETFPEPQSIRTDLLQGTNMVGMEFNTFFPWQINEDGTDAERLGHIGRHDMSFAFNRAINDDPNVVQFNFSTSGRSNKNPITTFMQIRENPQVTGQYFGVDAFQNGTHASGQIIALNAQPTLDPGNASIIYYTHRVTATPTFEGNTPNTNHSGLYRNPLPMANGFIICSHTNNTFIEKNMGSTTSPISRFAFRLKTLKQSSGIWIADQPLTSGISKSLSYWNGNVLISYSGELWELDAVEVRARNKPQARQMSLPTVEQQVFTEEGVDITKFRQYMRDKKIALAVGRDITHRDKTDKQQPFYLRVEGTQKQTPNATGKVYDVAFMQMYQGDNIRGRGMYTASSTPQNGRRVLAVPMHDVSNPPINAPSGSVGVAKDGSWAAFVHSKKAISWQLISNNGSPIVRERYWVSFADGEIRVCASCHGTNDGAISPLDPPPTNKPEALRSLLQFWKSTELPVAVAHISPPNTATPINSNQSSITLLWNGVKKAMNYSVQISDKQDFSNIVFTKPLITDTSVVFDKIMPGVQYYWQVKANNTYGESNWSNPWTFTVKPNALSATSLLSPPDKSPSIKINNITLVWKKIENAADYVVQLSETQTFTTSKYDSTVKDTLLHVYNLQYNKKYYWRVRAKNDNVSAQWSPIWSFQTVEEPLNITRLIAPPDKSDKIPFNKALLQWKKTPLAEKYKLQLSKNQEFSSILLDKEITDTQTIVQLAGNTRYYWRIKSEKSKIESEWSEAWSFITIPQLSDKTISLVLPLKGAKDVDNTNTVLQWTGLQGAEMYHVVLSEDSTFVQEPIINNKSVVDAQLKVNTLKENSTYFWKVRGYHTYDTSSWSMTSSFTTKSQVNGIGELENSMAVNVYPVPTDNALQIRITLIEADEIHVELFDMIGNTVSKSDKKSYTAGVYELAYNVSSIIPGVYGYRVYIGKEVYLGKFQVVR